MAKVRVNVKAAYDVHIAPGLINNCAELIKEVIKPCRTAIITDSNVAPLYLETVEKSLKDAGYTVFSFVFEAGEAQKNINTLSDILEFMAENRLTRTDMAVALGGGVVGDITGFAAASFLRGIKFVQIPTTLLAAVDSSVGGKTAIDLKAGKNLAGAFWQPSMVICDTDTLSTLTPEILACGAAEAIKTGVLFDEELFSAFEKNGIKKEILPFVIEKCVAHKGRIVEEDELDHGNRQLLNLGHTIGHGIEKCSHYEMLHGHAVAAGMAIIANRAVELGELDAATAKRICDTLMLCGLPTSTEYKKEDLISAALSDKKRAGDKMTLVIPKKIGFCELKKINIDDLGEYIV